MITLNKSTTDFLDDVNVFVSFADVPTEQILIRTDGDDSLVRDGGIPESPIKKSVLPPFIILNRVVPLPRNLKYGMKGNDVLAVKRALSEAGYIKWGSFTNKYRNGLFKTLKKFQHDHNLSANGVYEMNTHIKLKRFYDSYGAHLMVDMYKRLHPDPRQKILAAAMFGYNNRGSIHYTQSPLRMYGVKHHIFPPSIPIYEDCSSFATWTYYVAGLPDPNGLGYNGFGYTGTLANNGRKTLQANIGDFGLYGFFPYKHVTIYVGNGRVVSHGSEIGPVLTSLHYRPDLNHIRTYL